MMYKVKGGTFALKGGKLCMRNGAQILSQGFISTIFLDPLELYSK